MSGAVKSSHFILSFKNHFGVLKSVLFHVSLKMSWSVSEKPCLDFDGRCAKPVDHLGES